MSDKILINPPNFPSSISGSGKQVMTLLKKFVGEVAEQVNLLNGYTSGTSDVTIPVPNYFYLTFSNKGHEFEWDAVSFDEFDHYELRTNDRCGSVFGLLLKTTEVKATIPLLNRSDTVYLFVVNKDGDYCPPVTLNYNKPYPIAPYDIAVSKTAEGTMIFFAPIPIDCIGAVLYINQRVYTTASNNFLYTGEEIIADILIAYTDSFGEGEFCDIYFDPPVIQNFVVERNDYYLDFRWDNSPLYNAKYVIRKGINSVWEDGEVIAEVYTNSFRYVFPNDGNYYFLIKVYDEHGNASATCTWVSLETVPDIHRNVIFVSEQSPEFTGSLVNLNIDETNGALVLPNGQAFGEYYSSIELPQQYRARNWVDYNVYSYGESGLTWDDFVYDWNSSRADYSWAGELANNTSVVKNEISLNVGLPADMYDAISFNNSLVSESNVSPVDSVNVSYGDCYFTDGMVSSPTSGVLYNLDIPSDFSCIFTIRPIADFVADELYSGSFIRFIGTDVWLEVIYDDNLRSFVLRDHLGNNISVSVALEVNDIVFIGISQYGGFRKFFVKSKVGSDLDYNFISINSQKYNSLFLGNNVGVLS